jgi:iron(III) transport system ATP-binding protein
MYLSLESVAVRYAGARSGRAAVDGVSLGLDAGQIGVLIGPSGCGKTTLLRAMAGLEPMAGGRIVAWTAMCSATPPTARRCRRRRAASAWCSRTTRCSRT